MDIIEKIKKLQEERGWSIYTLALEAELTQSTLTSMFQRNNPPKIDTLKNICDAFGMTLAQFFMEDEEAEILTKDEKKLVASYRKLSDKKQRALIELLEIK